MKIEDWRRWKVVVREEEKVDKLGRKRKSL